MRAICALMFVFLAAISAAAQNVSPPDAHQLHSAVRRGDVLTVTRLLEQALRPDLRNSQGETALLLAVEAGHDQIASLLIKKGADINAQAANKDTPWLLAGARGRTEMLKEMLPKGPDYALRNRFGGSALIPACHYGHVATVRFLTAKSKIDINHINSLGWSCLLEAVILGEGGPVHQEIVRIVLASGASPNLADKDGVTPLVHAQRRGQVVIAKLIEQAGGQ